MEKGFGKLMYVGNKFSFICLLSLRSADKKGRSRSDLWDLEYRLGSISNNNLKLFSKCLGAH